MLGSGSGSRALRRQVRPPRNYVVPVTPGQRVSVVLRDGIVVIGNFDGVHLGHRALLAHARQISGHAKNVVALTFHPHPRIHFGRTRGWFELTPLPTKADAAGARRRLRRLHTV